MAPPSASRRRKLATVLALVVAGLATVATQDVGPSVQGDALRTVTVSRDSPAVLRLRVHLEHGDNEPYASIISAGPVGAQQAEEVIVSIVPEDAQETVTLSDGFEFYGPDDPVLDLIDVCRSGCARSYVVVITLAEERSEPVAAEIGALARAYYSGGSGFLFFPRRAEGAFASVGLEDPLWTDVAQLQASISASAEVTGQPSVAWQGTLTVPGELLTQHGARGGQLLLRGSRRAGPRNKAVMVEANVGGKVASGWLDVTSAGEAIALGNPLVTCQSGVDCHVPIELTMTVESGAGDMTVLLEVEARLTFVGDLPERHRQIVIMER